jgi:GntR family transcriptional regulator/GntR family frlABCD operon transcriptional regulator
MTPLYKKIYTDLKVAIDNRSYIEGDLLPSENEICAQYNTTRATVRIALNKLVNTGYIDTHKGKGSIVARPTKGLGILSITGVTAAIGQNKLETISVTPPSIKEWDKDFFFELTPFEMQHRCIYFSRLRSLNSTPVLYEETFMTNYSLPKFTSLSLQNRSLFNLLQSKYNLTIKRGEQNMWAIMPEKKFKDLLDIKNDIPVIHLKRRLQTNIKDLNLYSFIYCNTEEYFLQDFF